MDVHSLNTAIAAAMREVLPPDKTLMEGSYLDKDADAVRFITWAISRLTPEQAARLTSPPGLFLGDARWPIDGPAHFSMATHSGMDMEKPLN